MLSKITNREKIIIVFLLAALVALSIQQCSLRKATQTAENWEAKYKYQNQTIDSLTNKVGQLVYEQKTAQTNSEKEIKTLSSEVFNLSKREEARIKQVDALIRVYQTAHIDSVKIAYVHDTTEISAKDSTNYDNWVHVPKRFEEKNDSFSITGRVLKESVAIDKISIPDSSSFRIAEQRPIGFFNRLFKPNEQIVQSIHSSPLYTTTGMNSITLRSKVSAWNRWIKPSLTGLIAGAGVYKLTH